MIYHEFVFAEQEMAQLKEADDQMKRLIDIIGPLQRYYTADLFPSLINIIVAQQLSNKVADAIWAKLSSRFPDITPEKLLAEGESTYREIGLSNSKVRYIKNTAEAVLSGELPLETIHLLKDEEITERLTAIKGIGPWSAEMFLIFSLCRKDILSFGDLGIRKGIQWLYSLEEPLTIEQFAEIKGRYSPHGTLASLYLWEIGDRKFYKHKNLDEVEINKCGLI
jgi:DNA-3-methyladenine glycosylase II